VSWRRHCVPVWPWRRHCVTVWFIAGGAIAGGAIVSLFGLFCQVINKIHETHLKKCERKRASANSCVYVLVIKNATVRVFVLVRVYSIKPVMAWQIFYASVCELVRVSSSRH